MSANRCGSGKMRRYATHAGPTKGCHIDAQSTDRDAGYALFELAPRLTRLENAVLSEVTPPLTFRQYRILQRVAEGRTTVTALGRLATITLPAVSESVDVLVRKGLLERRTSAQDRRASDLLLTEDGVAALRTADRLLTETAGSVLAGVPVERRAALAADLRHVTEQVTRALLADRDASTG